jgi:energy-coupling factor transporter ATPase
MAEVAPIISFRDVRYRYHEDDPEALAGITFDILSGEYVAVIGSNGSGKSTLAKHINALYVPDSGTVTVAGLVTSEPAHTYSIRRHAGMVFQNPDNQMVTSIVEDDVAFGPENLGVAPHEICQRVTAALRGVGMDAFAEAELSSLSGGQRQRVAIAGILAMEPDILILDEPGAMLDPRGRRGIRRVSRELNRAGMTVVLITQHMEEALLADRVIVLSDGTVAMDGRPEDVFMHGDRLRDLHLDVPFTIRLAEALRARGLRVSDTLDEESLGVSICRSHSNA